MRDRGFADFLAGAFACISVLGICAVVKETEQLHEARRRASASRWSLPRIARSCCTWENDCRRCGGTGANSDGAPEPCAQCEGTGLQPRDAALTSRLTALWNA